MTLFHLTCGHGRKGIGRRGIVRPGPKPPWLDVALAWFTPDPDAPADALGLTSNHPLMRCDRTRFVYVVLAGPGLVPWVECPWRTPAAIRHLEGHRHGALEVHNRPPPSRLRPDLWWVSPDPVRVRLKQVRAGRDCELEGVIRA